MQIIRDYQFTLPQDCGASVAIGNFDGVHLGHQAVIDIAADHAKRLNCPLGVMTFEPHPRQYFAPDGPAFRLMSAESRANRLQKLGVEKLYEINFNDALSSLSARDFAQNVIKDGLDLKHVVIGQDFRFGNQRDGSARDLQAFGQEIGFGVTIAELIEVADTEVSSTAIRNDLSNGNPEAAALKLGHFHRIDGEVIRGEQRGRLLGFPTANMSITGLHPPKFGVYAVKIDVLSGPYAGSYDGAASIGVRPMFDGHIANLETHIFDFEGDIYGVHVSVALVEYLRPEAKFDSLDDLIAQMRSDCARARDILADV
ncbi:MAG: bifunctional riboflavin kinase/FMN adenylyltransferase [Rhodobacterales bacterium]|nr:MAG: bifunctional riboflavin kinase/FMN adenylyltransferase [Rhodobacterales bacterium]